MWKIFLLLISWIPTSLCATARVESFLLPSSLYPQGVFQLSLDDSQELPQGSFMETNRGSLDPFHKGELRILSSQDGKALAVEVSTGQKVQVGDKAFLKPLSIRARQKVLRTHRWKFLDLFEEPESHAVSMNLSRQGEEHLGALCQHMASLRVPGILVRANVSLESSSLRDKDQVESSERAQVVRQFLLERCKLSEDRVLSMGLGSHEPYESRETPSAWDRRIEIHFLPSL